MDGHALELDDDSFDVAGSQFGVMLFPDMPRGIGEMARVTRPGGRVLMNVLGRPARRSSSSASSWTRFQSVRPGIHRPTDGPTAACPSSCRTRTKLRQELDGARLKDVRVETITERLEFQSGSNCGIG